MSENLPAITDLPALARRIEDEHAQAETAFETGIGHAIEAGRLLTEAKGLVEHGEWLPWLTANTSVSARMAQHYMRLAREMPALAGDTKRVSHLSVRKAIASVTRSIERSLAELVAEGVPRQPDTNPAEGDTRSSALAAAPISSDLDASIDDEEEERTAPHLTAVGRVGLVELQICAEAGVWPKMDGPEETVPFAPLRSSMNTITDDWEKAPKFLGWNRFEWMRAPDELVKFFHLEGAVGFWRREQDLWLLDGGMAPEFDRGERYGAWVEWSAERDRLYREDRERRERERAVPTGRRKRPAQ